MRTIVAWVVVGFLLASGAGMAFADGLKPATRMSRDLAKLAAPPAAVAAAAPGAPDAFSELAAPVAAADPSALEAELIALGARDTAITGRLVSARLPIAAIPSLEGVASLQFARPAVPALAITGTISITTADGTAVSPTALTVTP